tara:strand:+ start:7932 stop:8444 length:513 start_codon:yes stop_codon:yes gene_type:complete
MHSVEMGENTAWAKEAEVIASSAAVMMYTDRISILSEAGLQVAELIIDEVFMSFAPGVPAFLFEDETYCRMLVPDTISSCFGAVDVDDSTLKIFMDDGVERVLVISTSIVSDLEIDAIIGLINMQWTSILCAHMLSYRRACISSYSAQATLGIKKSLNIFAPNGLPQGSA